MKVRLLIFGLLLLSACGGGSPQGETFGPVGDSFTEAGPFVQMTGAAKAFRSNSYNMVITVGEHIIERDDLLDQPATNFNLGSEIFLWRNEEQ